MLLLFSLSPLFWTLLLLYYCLQGRRHPHPHFLSDQLLLAPMRGGEGVQQTDRQTRHIQTLQLKDSTSQLSENQQNKMALWKLGSCAVTEVT